MARVLRLPGWFVFIVFVPIQIWIFFRMKDAWGLWRTVGTFLLVGLLAARATRPMGLRAMLFPWWAERWEGRRHVYQGILLFAAAVTWFAPWGPQPWLPAIIAVSAVKAGMR